jgi:hypothetical protein
MIKKNIFSHLHILSDKLLFVAIHDILTSMRIKSFNVIGISPYHIKSK